jgi:hypothetical protein
VIHQETFDTGKVRGDFIEPPIQVVNPPVKAFGQIVNPLADFVDAFVLGKACNPNSGDKGDPEGRVIRKTVDSASRTISMVSGRRSPM